MVDHMTSSSEFIGAGGLRPLALTAATRSQLLPDTPIVGSIGKDAPGTAAGIEPQNDGRRGR
jgi:tripartite-type tricarboxylate transporter receptor subunit TctC